MALCLLHPLQADAKRIKVDVKTPGTLATLVGDKNKNKITAITLKGRLNSADLRYLREMAGRDYEGKPTPGQLREIDMRGTSFVKEKADYAKFARKSRLRSQYLPVGLFYECPIEQIMLPDSVSVIANASLAKTNIREITLPEGVALDNYALFGCRQLGYVYFPELTSAISTNSLDSCDALRRIVVHNVDYISSKAFQQMASLEEIVVTGMVGHVDGWMCYQLPKLRRIEFSGDILSTGGPDIAQECPLLDDVTITGRSLGMGFSQATDCPRLSKFTVGPLVLTSGDNKFVPARQTLTAGEVMALDSLLAKAESRWAVAELYNKDGACYNYACALCRYGYPQKGMEVLDKAVGKYRYNSYKWMLKDEDLAPLREMPRFKELVDSLRREHDYLLVLRSCNGYQQSSPRLSAKFTYAAASDAKMKAIRQYFNLDSIAGSGDDVSQMKRIMLWLHDSIRHDGSGGFPDGVNRNAIDLYKACKAQKRGLNCRGLSIVLSELYMAMGWPSRFVTCQPRLYKTDSDCHVICMVWSESRGKWLWMDPSFAAYVSDENGQLLGIQEVRQRLRDDKPLILNPDANWNHENTVSKAQYLDNYMAKNLYFLSTYLDNGYNTEGFGSHSDYYTLAPCGTQMDDGICINDEGWFWQPPTQQ